MNFFSRFCNICYKYDNNNLKNICKSDTELIKCTLLALIGHADILNCNPIFLCQECCEKLINVDTFKNICFNNLIQLRKDYLHMKAELELKADTCTVQHVLNNFLDDQVFHKKYLGKSVEIESSDGSNQDFDVSIIESNECNISEGTKLHKNFDAEFPAEELDISNDNITLEGSELRVTESQSNENVNFGFKISNVCTVKEDCKDKDISNKERTKAERKLGIRQTYKNNIVEIESSDDSNQDFDVSIIESNECNISEGTRLTKNFDAEFPVEELDISNENNILEGSELRVTDSQSNEYVNFGFKIANVCSVKEDCKDKDTSNKERTIAETKLGIRKTYNNNNECNTSDREFMKSKLIKKRKAEFATEELDVRNEIENAISEDSEEVKNESTENVNTGFVISDVRSVTNTEECDDMDTSNELNTKVGMKLRSRKSCDYRIRSDDEDDEDTNAQYKAISEGTKKKQKKLHVCQYCNETFQTATGLVVHKRVHSRLLYRCTVCSKSFATMILLDNHKVVHSDARPYTCSVCKASFKWNQSLTRHKLVHTSERPHVCHVCNKTFARADHAATHRRVHDDDDHI